MMTARDLPAPREDPADAEHITIYFEPDYFAAWPFNHGFKAFSQKRDC